MPGRRLTKKCIAPARWLGPYCGSSRSDRQPDGGYRYRGRSRDRWVLSYSQVSEQLSREFEVLELATYDRAHLDAVRAAVCFLLAPDCTFYGDFAGNGPIPWPRTLNELPPEVLDIWQAYADHVRSAALRAHLHDLLAAAGMSQRYAHARATVSPIARQYRCSSPQRGRPAANFAGLSRSHARLISPPV
jgi:hypothetical protein